MRNVQACDLPMLELWCEQAPLRIARRAWIVLNEAQGVQPRELAQATPLPSRTVAGLSYFSRDLVRLFQKRYCATST